MLHKINVKVDVR